MKYEEVYLKAYQNGPEAKAGIGGYLRLYNAERPHQALDYQTPRQVFEAGCRLVLPWKDGGWQEARNWARTRKEVFIEPGSGIMVAD